jgi:hypothetical protein
MSGRTSWPMNWPEGLESCGARTAHLSENDWRGELEPCVVRWLKEDLVKSASRAARLMPELLGELVLHAQVLLLADDHDPRLPQQKPGRRTSASAGVCRPQLSIQDAFPGTRSQSQTRKHQASTCKRGEKPRCLRSEGHLDQVPASTQHFPDIRQTLWCCSIPYLPETTSHPPELERRGPEAICFCMPETETGLAQEEPAAPTEPSFNRP